MRPYKVRDLYHVCKLGTLGSRGEKMWFAHGALQVSDMPQTSTDMPTCLLDGASSPTLFTQTWQADALLRNVL
jgi:hypothetical protein